MSILISAIAFLVMISLLVAAHELGHFLFARWFKMDVEEFAIGFGKQKWVYAVKNGTEFTIRPFPLGGFVRIKGMMPEDDGSEVNVPNGFYSKSPFARLMVLFAGPLFSIVFGALLLSGVYSIVGMEKPSNEPVIGRIAKDGVADKAGLKVSDRVLQLDGKPVYTFFEVLSYVRERPEVPVKFTVQRESEQLDVMLTPAKDKKPTPVIGKNFELTDELKIQGKMNAQWDYKQTRIPFTEAVGTAFMAPFYMAAHLAQSFMKPAQLKDEFGGIGTIAVVTHDAVNKSMGQVFNLAAMLSMSLGFMNLLPFHPLDGGQMLVAFFELLRKGKRLSIGVQQRISTVGLFVVMLLVVSVLFIDINRFRR